MVKAILLLLVSITASAAVSTSDRALVERGNNLLRNGGFEQGKVDWTASAGTFATTTTAANVGKGSVAATWDAAASGNTLTSSAVAIPAGLYGRNGVASCLIQGASATHTLQAYDGTNILASQTISSQSAYSRTSVNFIYPSSGNIQLRLYANADEPSIAIDDCFLGDADGYNISQISQAQFVGAVKITGCSAAWSTTSTSYANFSAGTSCSYSTSGSALAPSTNIPAIRFSSLPAGEYMLVYEGLVVKDGSVNTIGLRFSDGTNTSREESFYKNNAGSNEGGQSGFTQSINYSTSQSNITLQIQAKVSANNGYIHGTTANPGVIRVYRFPSSSEIAYRADVSNRTGSIKIAGATNCTWSTTSASYASFTADSDCGTQTVVGSATAPGTKLAAGTFTNLPAGKYLAIAQGKFETQYATSTTDCNYQLWDGTNSIATASSYSTSGTAFQSASTIAGVVEYAANQSSISLEVRGMRNGGGGNCNITNNTTSTNLVISLISLDQALPYPNLVGSVISNTSGQERVERAAIICSGSSSIASQSGSWLSSIGNISSGTCTITIASGIFSGGYSCVLTKRGTLSATTHQTLNVDPVSATSLVVGASLSSSGSSTIAASSGFNADLICMGAK